MSQRALKVAHFSTHGNRGGAGKAAWRLHAALRQLQVDSRMISCSGVLSEDGTVAESDRWPHHSEAWDLVATQTLFVDANRTPLSDTLFSIGLPGPDLLNHPAVATADLLHLHWINGLLSIPMVEQLLASGKPVIWSCHDQWAFTGGCHYTAGCKGFTAACTPCPQLRSGADRLPQAVLADKLALWKPRGPLGVVALTNWMGTCIRESRLFADAEIEHIPNGIDLSVFNPSRRAAARERLGIEADCFLFLFVCESLGDRRKGYEVLQEAITQASNEPTFAEALRVHRVAFAAIGHAGEQKTSVHTKILGWIARDEEIADVCAAADAFLAPSLEDNQPNTVVESLACGTPIIGSAIGGIFDLVEPSVTGELVPAGDPAALAQALCAAAAHPDRFRAMRPGCRARAEGRYCDKTNAQAMMRFYERLGRTARPAEPQAPSNSGPYGPAVGNFVTDPQCPIPPEGLHQLGSTLESRFAGMLRYLSEVEADRAARLAALVRMQQQLDEHGLGRLKAETKVTELSQALHDLTAHLASMNADQQARLDVISSMQAELDSVGSARNQAEARVRNLEEKLAGTIRNLNEADAERARLHRLAEQVRTPSVGSEDHGLPPAR